MEPFIGIGPSLPAPGSALAEELDKKLLVQVDSFVVAPSAALPSAFTLLLSASPSPEFPLIHTVPSTRLTPPSLLLWPMQLRDGKKIIGILRSFDQFANLVLEGAVERIIVGEQYGDIPLGLNVVRGENVVLLGEIDETRPEVPPNFKRVSEAEINLARQAEKTEETIKNTMHARMDFLDLD